MKNAIFSLVIVMTTSLWAQNTYSVKVIVKDLASQPIEFGILNGATTRTQAIANKSTAKSLDTLFFTGTDKIEGGVYYLNILNLKKRVDFIVEPNDHLTISLYKDNAQPAVFQNSPVNSYYKQIKEIILSHPDSVNTMGNKQLENIVALQKKVMALRSNPSQNFTAYREQYFNMDWHNQNYAHLPNYMGYLNMFFFFAAKNHTDYVQQADYVLSIIPAHSENYNITLEWMFANLEFLKFDQYQELYKTLANRYLTPENADSKLLDHYKINRNVKLYTLLPNGSKAPLFTLQNQKNESVTLASILAQNDYTLLVFYDSSCNHCKQRIPLFHAELKELKNLNKVAILTPDDDADFSRWDYFIGLTGINDWLNLKLDSKQSKVKEDYNVTAFPLFFLIDKNGVIIEKPDKPQDILKKIVK